MKTIYCIIGICTIAFIIMAIANEFAKHQACLPEPEVDQDKNDIDKIFEGYLWSKESGERVDVLYSFVQISKNNGDYDAFDIGVEKYIAEMQDKEIG